MKTTDLHTHSTASDGSMTPAEVVRHAKEQGLSAFALTDHDTVKGLPEALAEGERIGIEVVPGIELTGDAGEFEVHIIGLFIDPDNAILSDALIAAEETRNLRNVKMVNKLQEAGINISMGDLAKFGDKALSKAHIAAVLIERGYAASTRDAINKFMVKGTPGYTRRENIAAERCIELIHEAGGIAILAHINQISKDKGQAKAVCKRLADAELDGLEVVYTEYDEGWTTLAEEIAKEYILLSSGGSDFHGSFKQGLEIGRGYENILIPYAFLEELKAKQYVKLQRIK